jgi:hypothetical protein
MAGTNRASGHFEDLVATSNVKTIKAGSKNTPNAPLIILSLTHIS